jgi:hypothetical protein
MRSFVLLLWLSGMACYNLPYSYFIPKIQLRGFNNLPESWFDDAETHTGEPESEIIYKRSYEPKYEEKRHSVWKAFTMCILYQDTKLCA